MLIKQSDLFQGTSMDFVKKFMDISSMRSHAAGHILFHEGDHAGYLYILVKGSVQLTIGKSGEGVYNATETGEAFGWSSLIGRKTYSTSAVCTEKTEVLIFDKMKLLNILEKDTVNGLIFFKHLSATLGRRLIQSYKVISPTYGIDVPSPDNSQGIKS